jgi:hypothetical protein
MAVRSNPQPFAANENFKPPQSDRLFKNYKRIVSSESRVRLCELNEMATNTFGDTVKAVVAAIFPPFPHGRSRQALTRHLRMIPCCYSK